MLAGILVPLAVQEELYKLKAQAKGELPGRNALIRWIWKKIDLEKVADKSLIEKIQKSGLLDEKLMELNDEEFILILLILLAAAE